MNIKPSMIKGTNSNEQRACLCEFKIICSIIKKNLYYFFMCVTIIVKDCLLHIANDEIKKLTIKCWHDDLLCIKNKGIKVVQDTRMLNSQ